MQVESTVPFKFAVDENSFMCLLFTDAYNASVECNSELVRVKPGNCIFIPAGAGKVKVTGDATVLMSEL